MNMKTQHQVFLLEMIRHGDKTKAYQAAYPGATGESLRKGAERLLKEPEIALFYYETVSKIRERAFQEAEQERLKKEKDRLTDIQTKREALASIITGKTKIRKHIRMGDRIETVEEDVKPRDIIRAIEADSKLAADYYGENLAEEKDGILSGMCT